MSITLISLHDVYKYDVIKPYNIDIKTGEFILLTGKNGSGKTTLLRLILGFIKPDKGLIKRKKAKISYLPEQMSLPHFVEGYHFIKLHMHMKKCDINSNLLHLFDVPLFRHVHQLSKGNQQKLSIISTLIGHGELIILDEPLSGFDDKSIEKLINYLEELKNVGVTIIVSSHQPDVFSALKTRTISL